MINNRISQLAVMNFIYQFVYCAKDLVMVQRRDEATKQTVKVYTENTVSLKEFDPDTSRCSPGRIMSVASAVGSKIATYVYGILQIPNLTLKVLPPLFFGGGCKFSWF